MMNPQAGKPDLLDLALKKAIRENMDSPDKPGNLSISAIPVNKMYEQAQRIENVILPRVEKSVGRGSEDYRFYVELYRSLLYALLLVDRWGYLQRKLSRSDLENSLLKENLLITERELQKYSLVEDLFTTDALDQVAAAVKKRIENLLKPV